MLSKRGIQFNAAKNNWQLFKQEKNEFEGKHHELPNMRHSSTETEGEITGCAFCTIP